MTPGCHSTKNSPSSSPGVSIVAVLRDEDAYPAPGPEYGLLDDDTVVVVGTPEGITATAALLSRT